MREILFRGKAKLNGYIWVGSLIRVGDGRCFIVPIINSELSNSEIKSECGIAFQEVIPETVSQFTGITDKNGKMIFEGDIMLLGDGTKRKTVIEYDSLRAQFVARLFEKNSIRMSVSFWSVGEIIGNIHDNKEFMEIK